MFRWSMDEFIASKQKETADKLLNDIYRNCTVQYSKDIEGLCEKVTFSYLEEFYALVKNEFNERIIIAVIPRELSAVSALQDIKLGFDTLGKSWQEPLPYIEHSFPENYTIPHSEDFRHCYFFFFTQYPDFKASEECVKYYLNRINKLKAFL